uniref:Ig-like domain-containing protein n=1 Tax=Zonotrichia albicollis TaxID=44394 RepID=A0A8D2M3H7_ZONAL
VPMFCLSFGWPQRPCSQGVCATWMGCTGGCDTDMSPCLSKSFEDHPDTLSHKNCCPHGDNNPLVLQVPARPLLEGDTLTVCCRCRQDNHLTRVPFYREEKDLRESLRRTKLFLSPLQVYHSGHYRCEDLVGSWQSQSAPVTVTVHKLFSVPVLKGPRELTVQSLLNLSCCSTPSPLQPQAPLLHVFYRDEQVAGGLQVSPQLLVPAMGEGSVRKSSARLHITVHSECGDGHGEPPQIIQVPHTAWHPPALPDTCSGVSNLSQIPPCLQTSFLGSLTLFPHPYMGTPILPWCFFCVLPSLSQVSPKVPPFLVHVSLHLIFSPFTPVWVPSPLSEVFAHSPGHTIPSLGPHTLPGVSHLPLQVFPPLNPPSSLRVLF